MNHDLSLVLVNYLAILGALVVTVLAVAVSRWSWLRAKVIQAQEWAIEAKLPDITAYVDEPTDPVVMQGVKFANAVGLKVTADEVAAIMPDLITAFVTGLGQSKEVTDLVQSKLDQPD